MKTLHSEIPKRSMLHDFTRSRIWMLEQKYVCYFTWKYSPNFLWYTVDSDDIFSDRDSTEQVGQTFKLKRPPKIQCPNKWNAAANTLSQCLQQSGFTQDKWIFLEVNLARLRKVDLHCSRIVFDLYTTIESVRSSSTHRVPSCDVSVSARIAQSFEHESVCEYGSLPILVSAIGYASQTTAKMYIIWK